MAKKKTSRQNDPGLKLDVSWEAAAEKLLRTPAGATPPRKVAARKKAKKSSGPRKRA